MIEVATLMCLALSATQAEAPGPVVRWTLDGDITDSGPGHVPTEVRGRLEFIESPVGHGVKMAALNGVDAYLEADPPGSLGAGSGSFTLSAWIFALDRRASALFARPGWSLTLTEREVLRFAAGSVRIDSPPLACPSSQWNHVGLTVERIGERARTDLWVNGERVATQEMAAVNLDPPAAPFFMGKGAEDGRLFSGFLGDVRLYSRALAGAECGALAEAGIPWIRPHARRTEPFGGKFELLPQDVVALIGGENLRVAADLGYLETLLDLAQGAKPFHVRSMAWEGDTVFEQPRPVNFGSWADQFRRVGATVLFVQFGQIECLEGPPGLDRFRAAYEALLAQFARTTRRIVLVSPSLFGRGSPLAPDLRKHNEDLRRYTQEIRTLAARLGYLFIDLGTPVMAPDGFTRDGLHLSTAGQWTAAKEIARQLEIPGLSDLDAPTPEGAFPRPAYEALRSGIRRKNVLFSESWRPTNWAFLGGDRIEQPSSRDHLDRRIRWFPIEVQEIPALVRREEEKIEALLRTPEKK